MLGGAKAAAAANPPAAKRRRRVPSGAASSALSSSFLGASESDTSCPLLTALGLILTEKADAKLEQQRVLATERRAVHLIIMVTESVSSSGIKMGEELSEMSEASTMCF